MRSLDKRRSDYFTPDVPPTNPEDLPTWLFNQLQNMSAAVFNVNALHTERMYALPPRYKPREGDIILTAAGVVGENSGLYYYNGEDWIHIAHNDHNELRKISTDNVFVDAGISPYDIHNEGEMTQTQLNSMLMMSIEQASDDSDFSHMETQRDYLPLTAGNEHKVSGTIHLDDERRINVAWGESGKLSYDGGERLKWGNGYIWAFKPLDMQENRIVNVATPEKDEDAVNKKYVDGQAGGVPVGSIMFWLKSTPPSGWLKLHGGTFDIIKYPKLHSYFNSTEGYTSGILPNWAGRYPVEHGDHAQSGLGAMIGDRTKLPTNSPITAKTEHAYPDGSTRSFSSAGGTNAYSDGLSYFDVELRGGDNVTRPPSVIGHYIVKHD